MYNVKGVVSFSTESRLIVFLACLFNIGFSAFMIMVVGWLFHIGWNWI